MTIKHCLIVWITPKNHFIEFHTHHSKGQEWDSPVFNIPIECCLPLSSKQHSQCKHILQACLCSKYNLKNIDVEPNEQSTCRDPHCKSKVQKAFDTRLLQCFNPNCEMSKDENDNKVKSVFHFCCYHQMIYLAKVHNQDFPHILIDKTNIHRVLCTKESIAPSLYDHVLKSQDFTMVVPVCCKRCHNTVKNRTNFDGSKVETTKKSKNTDKDPKNLQFDKDGSDNACSSEKIVIDWITDERTHSFYFGGTGTDGKTKGLTKDAYHKQIAKIIKNKNGE